MMRHSGAGRFLSRRGSGVVSMGAGAVLLSLLVGLSPGAGGPPSAESVRAAEAGGAAATRPAPEGMPGVDLERPAGVREPLSWRLGNGLLVAVLPDERSPYVTLEMHLPASAFDDPPGKEGLAWLTANYTLAGAGEMTASQMAALLNRLGLQYRVAAGLTGTTILVEGYRDHTAEALKVLAEAVRRPRFEATLLSMVRTALSEEQEERLSDARQRGSQYLQRFLYPESRRRAPVHGLPQTLARLERDDVVEFHRRLYVPAGSALLCSGSVDAEGILALADALLGDWSGTLRERPPRRSEVGPRGREMIIVDRLGTRQIVVAMGQAVTGASAADLPTADVVNALLVRGRSGRLAEALADAGVTVTSLHAGFSFDTDAAFLAVVGEMDIVHAEAFVRTVTAVLEALRAGTVPEAELAEARAWVVGQFGRAYQTPAAALEKLYLDTLRGFPEDFHRMYPVRVARVSAQDVAGLMERWVDPARLVHVVEGPADALNEPMTRIHPVLQVFRPPSSP